MELRIFGPPGTGKTTYMAGQVGRAAERYGPENVFVASFTRAAAAEIASRGLPIPRQMVGTLHAHAYRALGRPEIAEKHLKEWNANASGNHALSAGADLDDAIEQNYGGEADELMSRYQTYRSMLRPREMWEADVRHFAQRWESWKKENEYIDFTDMIALALEDIDAAPGDPAIGFFDEAQDFTPLELALVRKWGDKMQFSVLAGDDDQSIYGFKGATPDAFLDPVLPDSQKRVLNQSYRVPRQVHSVAERWISRLSRRESKLYKPRDFDGRLRVLTASNEYGNKAPTFERPDALLRDAERYLEQGKSVMFLGACSYMLDPIKHELKDLALPFHNPFRRKNGGWNPLHVGKGISPAGRLAKWMNIAKGEWTPKDVQDWSYHMSKPRVFLRGRGEKAVKAAPMQYGMMPDELVRQTFTSEFIYGLSKNWIDYFEELLLESKRSMYEYPLAVLRKHGVEALTADPKILIGTIHSVKGGEADVVYLFPDLSRAGYSQWIGSGSDEIRRQMYVGMTRCKEELILVGNASPLAVKDMHA